jgi:hypothetical protein
LFEGELSALRSSCEVVDAVAELEGSGEFANNGWAVIVAETWSTIVFRLDSRKEYFSWPTCWVVVAAGWN